MQKIKVAILGSNGRLGYAFSRILHHNSNVQLFEFNRKDGFDLTNANSWQHQLFNWQPQLIINAAAYTNVEQAQLKPHRAHEVNVVALAQLAGLTKLLNAWLISFSSDYVFAGLGHDWHTEDSDAQPLNVYGLSKVLSERCLQQSGCNYLLFRTSWLYGEKADGCDQSFVNQILQLLQTKQQLSVVSDQIGSPTCTTSLAKLVWKIWLQAKNKPELAGLYHACATGAVSRFELAQYILQLAKQTPLKDKIVTQQIMPISSNNWDSLATRPLNSRLSTKLVQDKFSLKMLPWQDDLRLWLRQQSLD